jgi:hypothetical protein
VTVIGNRLGCVPGIESSSLSSSSLSSLKVRFHSNTLSGNSCPCGQIGKGAPLRTERFCRFESDLGHQILRDIMKISDLLIVVLVLGLLVFLAM